MIIEGNWLQVETDDPTPQFNSVNTCLTLCDVKCDNYIRLVVADLVMEDEPKAKLKVYRGLKLTMEQTLPGLPAAIESLYIDETEPKTPIIAVAIAESVLFYRNMKPYFKYVVPELEVDEVEKEVWRKLPVVRAEQHATLLELLKNLDRAKLTRKSQKLFLLNDEERNNFIEEQKDGPLTRYASIVSMRCLQRLSSDANPPSYLVLALENGDILILEPQSFSVLYKGKTTTFETTPSIMDVQGTYEMDFRIVIATRYGGVYLLRKATTEGQEIIKMSEPLTGLMLLPIDQTVIISSTDRRLCCYSKKGKQLYNAPLSAVPICMTSVPLPHLGLTLICVALEGGLVQFYMQKYLVDEFQVQSTVVAMLYGRMGLEDCVLSLVTIEGELIVKILRRVAVFEPGTLVSDKNKQDQKTTDECILQKPKKSSIFVEQAAREKQNPKASYGSFQTELWRLRLTAARTTLDALQSLECTISSDITHAPVKLSAEVCGVGPAFRLYLTIHNLSTYKMAGNLKVLLHADRRHYTMVKSLAKLPSILPGIPIKIDFEVVAVLDPSTKLPPFSLTPDNSHIRVMLVKALQAKPLIAAIIAMPASEADF
ncbi:Bardet-Biedl syndrome 1 protein homolog [Teleopsis dalmanni]|uniref:Bardet-Biedl syndrome 1 protein homolog n=1 Tax=Teleopsis dalmanni TaxID=139649 RepID=UPI0018CD8FC0|nr:Bardet-Biedl syndrome 1 protein homolog [Teleopsis dalmanni]